MPLPEDVALARRHRRSPNRVGFAVQLVLVRDLGRPLQIGEVLPAAVVDTVVVTGMQRFAQARR
jgi:hypothetical protein